MSTERLAPNSILTSTGCTGTVSDLTNDPDSGTDGNWVTADSDTTDIVLEVDFPDVSGPLAKGSGLQEIRARVAESQIGNTPDNVTMAVYEGGSLVTTLYNVGNPSYGTGGAVISGTWDAADLSTQSATADVRVRITCTADASPPPQVASLDVDSIEWNPTYVGGTVLPDNKLEAPALLIPGVAPAVRCRLDQGNPLAANSFYLFGPNGGTDLGSNGNDIGIPNTGTHTLEGWENNGATANCGPWEPPNRDMTRGAVVFHWHPKGTYLEGNTSFIYDTVSGGHFYFNYSTSGGGKFSISYRGGFGATVTNDWTTVITDDTTYREERIIGCRWDVNIGCSWWENGQLQKSVSTTTGSGALATQFDEPTFCSNVYPLLKSWQFFNKYLGDAEMSAIVTDPYCALVPE